MTAITTLKKATRTQLIGTNLSVAQIDIDTTVTPLESAGQYELFDLPKGAQVVSAFVSVRTGEGAAETVDLGVTGALTQFLDDKSLETAGTSYMMAATAAYFASAQIAVVLLANAALTAAKFTVGVVYAMVEAAE